MSESLPHAWAATDYRVRLPGGGHASIRCGKPLPPALRRLLEDPNQPWGYLTAWNPGSVRLPRASNRARQRRLRDALKSGHYNLRPGVGVGTGNWRESSLFIPGIDYVRLDALARRFGQLGVLRGTAADAAELHEVT